MPEHGNVITQNAAAGVAIVAGTANQVLGNSIIDNEWIGIDLGPLDGTTTNDRLDPDVGPNNLQNFPLLTSAAVSGTELVINGTLDTTAWTTVRLEPGFLRGSEW